MELPSALQNESGRVDVLKALPGLSSVSLSAGCCFCSVLPEKSAAMQHPRLREAAGATAGVGVQCPRVSLDVPPLRGSFASYHKRNVGGRQAPREKA